MDARARLGTYVVAVPLAVFLGAFASDQRAVGQPSPAEVGRDLFAESCASCHGDAGRGTELGPSLAGVGAASADFQLRTGRMPLSDPQEQTLRKPPAFTPEQIEALVAYVASLGAGPAIPAIEPAAGDLDLGQELFVANCAPCHGATGNGGATGEDALAPSLFHAAPIEVAEAVITGPGEMPVFELSPQERDSIIAFLNYLESERDPGGADIGGVGPVPEGFVAWAVGMGLLLMTVIFVGARKRDR